MNSLIKTITEEELKFISSADYNQDSLKHYKALKEVIFVQDGIVNNEQSWFPYEVIELSSNSLKENHQREFVICTLLIILNVKVGADTVNDLDSKFNSFSGEYEKLSNKYSEIIISEYINENC